MSLLNTPFNNQAESNANKSSPENGNSSSPQKEAEGKADQREEEEIDIDLTDPEVEKAATKIQAGFKGMKARQQVREKRDLMPMVRCSISYDLQLKITHCCLSRLSTKT